jgi:hypothetical protein
VDVKQLFILILLQVVLQILAITKMDYVAVKVKIRARVKELNSKTLIISEIPFGTTTGL